MKTRVVIADDHHIFLDGLKTVFRKEVAIEIVGEASNGLELIEICIKLKPDVVITDIRMPILDGIDATKKLKQLMPSLPVIALTTYDEGQIVNDMINAGAKGYLLKSVSKKDLIQAIETVKNGGVFFDSVLSNTIALQLMATKNNHVNNEIQKFSEREIAIIQMISKGLTGKEIAEELDFSLRTFEGHKEKIMKKLNANNIAALVVQAIRNNVISIQ